MGNRSNGMLLLAWRRTSPSGTEQVAFDAAVTDSEWQRHFERI